MYIEYKEVKNYGFKDQITRSGLSVPLNIAKGSLAELKTQIIIGNNIAYISDLYKVMLLKECDEIAAMSGELIKSKKTKI